MNHDIKFSILIPAFKSTFFKECIDSILSQSYENFELIILNDASPEPIDDIINIYNDARIIYCRNDVNCGSVNVVDNWNKLLNLATGDYVICLGDDDKLLKNCLSDYYNAIVKYPTVEVFHGWTEIIDESSNFFKLQEQRPEKESVYSMIWHRWNGRVQYIGDFCYKRDSLLNSGGFYKLPLAWASDDITSYIAASKNDVVNLQTLVFQYRVNSQSITSSGNKHYKLKAMDNEYVWYINFLKIIPLNDLDQKYHQLITNNIDWYFKKRKLLIIREDLIKSKLLNTLFWFRNKENYNISNLMIFKSFFDSIPFLFKIDKNKV